MPADPTGAYAAAMAQFQDCLYRSGGFSALNTCGYAAGYSYGLNAAAQAVDWWQFVAGLGWALAGAAWCVVAYLAIKLSRRPR